MADLTTPIPDEKKEEILFNDNGRNLKANDIVNEANKGVYLHIENMNWGKKKRDAFMQAYSSIMEDIASGNIDSRSAGLKYHSKLGNLSNSSDGFDAVGEVLYYLDPIINYSNASDSNSGIEDYNPYSFNEFFINKRYGGAKPTQSQWDAWRNLDVDDANGNRQKINRAKELANLIPSYIEHINSKNINWKNSPFGSKEEYIRLLNEAQTKLNDGVSDDDINAFSKLGINLNDFLSDSVEGEAADIANNELPQEENEHDKFIKAAKELNPGLSDEAAEVLWQQQQKQIQLQNDAILHENEWQNYYNTNYTNSVLNNFKLSLKELQPDFDYKQWDKHALSLSTSDKKKVDKQYEHYLKNPDQLKKNNVNSKWFRYIIYNDAISADNGTNSRLLKTTNPDVYIIKPSIDDKTGLAYFYNKKNKTIYRAKVDINKTPTLLNELKNRFMKRYQTNQYKEGGTLLQQGGWIERTTQDRKNRLETYKQTVKESGKTEKEFKHDTKEVKSLDDFSASDWVRFGAAVGDLTGAIAAFVPGGSVYSFGQGLTSDFARAGADIADGTSVWNATKNLGMGLGMTVISSLPIIGTEGKIAKAMKGLTKFIPAALSIGSNLSTYGPCVESLEKINNGKGTVQDYKNVLTFFTSVCNTSKVAGSSLKAKLIKDGAKTGTTEEITVQGKNNTKIKLTSEELNQLKGAESNQKANELLKSFRGHENDEIDFGFFGGTKVQGNSWYNRGMSVNENSTPEYDFNTFIKTQLKTGNKGWAKDAIFMNKSLFPWSFKFNGSYGPASMNTQTSINTPTVAPLVLQVVTPQVRQVFNTIKPGSGPTSRQVNVYKSVASTHNAGRPADYNIGTPHYNQNELNLGIEFDKQGGILKADGGAPLGIAGADDWEGTVGSLTWNELLKRLEANKDNKDYYKTINLYQDEHSDLRTRGKNQWGADKAWKDDKVKEYQTKYQGDNYNDIAILPNYESRYQRPGTRTSGDAKSKGWVSDGLYAGITDDRRLLGRDNDYSDDLVVKKNEQLKAYNLELYKGTDGYWRLKELGSPDPSNSNSSNNNSSNSNPSNNTGSSATANHGNLNFIEQLKGQFKNIDPNKIGMNVIPVMSLRDSIRTNRKNFNDVYGAIKPTLKDTYWVPRQIVGDLATKNYMNNEAAKVEELGTKATTSDATLNKLAAFNSFDKAQELREKGHLADNNKIDQTKELFFKNVEDYHKRLAENAFFNNSQMNESKLAKAQLKVQHRNADYASRDTFRKELYNKFDLANERQRQFNQQYLQAMAPNPDNDPAVKMAAQAYQLNPTKENYDKYIKVYQAAAERVKTIYFDNYANLEGFRIPQIRRAKDGAKIRLKYNEMVTKYRSKDNERFDKNMRAYYKEYMKKQRALGSEIASHLKNLHKKK